MFLLLLVIIGNAGRIYASSLGPDLSARYIPTPTYITTAIWMLMLTFTGTTEVFLFIARVYITKATKCILIWVRHSIYNYTKTSSILSVFLTGHCTQCYSVCCVFYMCLSNDMVSSRLDYPAPHTSSNS